MDLKKVRLGEIKMWGVENMRKILIVDYCQ